MTISDALIGSRDALLNRLMRVDSSIVLNQSGATSGGSAALPAILANMMGELKTAAVDAGGHQVDYRRLAESKTYSSFRSQVVAHLHDFDLTTLSSTAERTAFWIDLYNVLVIDGVVSFGIEKSVTEGWVGIMSFFRRAAYDVGGHRFSCDDIEHGILRDNRGHPYLPGPHFGPCDARRAFVVTPVDPRIHFALNCASRSCPPIRAYEPTALDKQLDLAAKAFLHSELQIDQARGQVSLPAIFQWFRRDFGGRSGILSFLLNHMPQGDKRDWLAQHQQSVALTYRSHDWKLNQAKTGSASHPIQQQANT